jgi:hypothetical protein
MSYAILFLDAMGSRFVIKVWSGTRRFTAPWAFMATEPRILGILIENTEWTKFWLRVMNDLKNWPAAGFVDTGLS